MVIHHFLCECTLPLPFRLEFDRLGYAAALSVVLFGIVLAMTLVNWRINRAAREA